MAQTEPQLRSQEEEQPEEQLPEQSPEQPEQPPPQPPEQPEQEVRQPPEQPPEQPEQPEEQPEKQPPVQPEPQALVHTVPQVPVQDPVHPLQELAQEVHPKHKNPQELHMSPRWRSNAICSRNLRLFFTIKEPRFGPTAGSESARDKESVRGVCEYETALAGRSCEFQDTG